jgi:SAM-dependent methyltransferase
MSDGPSKMAPPGADPPPLDDIILGDDDQTVPIPPVRRVNTASAAPPAPHSAPPPDPSGTTKDLGASDDRPSRRERSSNRIKAALPAVDATTTRKRSKMTLRIPDDEISRPQLPATTPTGGIPAIGGSRPPSNPGFGHDDEEAMAMPLRPQRIISIGSADDTLELPKAELEARGATLGRAPGIDNAHEAGWTPYQPAVADLPERSTRSDRPAAPTAMREPARTMIDEPGMGAAAMGGAMMQQQQQRDETPSVPPASEDIPIDTDDDEPELATNPRLPAALDSEEIRIDDGERHTDPGEVPEVDADDLVSVESIPGHAAHSPHAPPPLKGGVKLGITPSPPMTATALMSGVAPAAAVPIVMNAPLASSPLPLAATKSPSVPAPAAHAPTQPHNYVPAVAQAALPPQAPEPHQEPPRDHLVGPAAGTPMARRQQPAGGPFGFMPQVGALAPPPMNESAANRKKTRPWWEDLFNDDFIRTMAKITDADIAREANFIEESLGCEAGATILDLACGTGRHAVELAGRGYQVVGFDLSLAMLARASDEAQDRKQKINFVQGDMREMTFEETFDGVFSWNTSFGYFEDEKNAAVIAKVHRALKKGGQFLLDVVNRDCIIRSAPSLAWFEGDGCICMDEMQIDFITSRMKVKRTLMMDDGRTKEIEYSIRVYSLHELGKMLHDNGFRVAEVSGGTGTPGVFFGCEAPRTLILAEKR